MKYVLLFFSDLPLLYSFFHFTLFCGCKVSALNANALADPSANVQSRCCAVSLWTDISVRLFTLPDLRPLAQETLGGDVIARSLLLVTLEGIDYLMCGLGDGKFVSFILEPGKSGELKLTPHRKMSLGTQPVLLTMFVTAGTESR
jgi:DNA damage-binding protein 1